MATSANRRQFLQTTAALAGAALPYGTPPPGTGHWVTTWSTTGPCWAASAPATAGTASARTP